jgi:hypothetical protein
MRYYNKEATEKLQQDLMQKYLAAMNAEGETPVTDEGLLQAEGDTLRQLMAIEMGRTLGDNADDFKIHATSAARAVGKCLEMLALARSIRGRQLDAAAKAFDAEALPAEAGNTKRKAKI